MGMERVALIKGKDPTSMSKKALELIDAAQVFSPEDRVLIKPNCVIPKHPSTGVTVDSRVIDGIIEFIMACGVKDIIIGEGGNPGTDKTFDITGIREVASKHNLRLINFNKDEVVEVKIPYGQTLRKVVVAKTVLKSTCIVNVPKLKIHHMVQVTLAIKNLMGVIVGNRRTIMHDKLDGKLVDLASLIKPKLNIVDGLVGSEMDETYGRPIPMNVVIAGRDMVAVDVVGSAVMGVDPKTVRHICLAAERGLGIGTLKEIEVQGESIKNVMKKFSQELSEEKLRKSYGISDVKISREKLKKLWENRS
jgi:uncharacterized protein (DUF362 family)